MACLASVWECTAESPVSNFLLDLISKLHELSFSIKKGKATGLYGFSMNVFYNVNKLWSNAQAFKIDLSNPDSQTR